MPFIPILFCLNKKGNPSSSIIAKEIKTKKGDKISNNIIPNNLFKIFEFYLFFTFEKDKKNGSINK